MAKSREKLLALKLRKQGMSYSQIKERVKVSKSSLSLWLKNYPLNEQRIRELRDFSSRRIENFRRTMLQKREKRRQHVFEAEKKGLLPLTTKELYIAGLFLYWGEGGKTTNAQITFSNTDPDMLRFYLRWLMESMRILPKAVVVRLHLYRDMDERKEVTYWGKELGLPKTQFRKSYIKKTTLKGLTYKNRGHGTCNLIVYGRDYYERVMMGIQAICGQFHGLG